MDDDKDSTKENRGDCREVKTKVQCMNRDG